MRRVWGERNGLQIPGAGARTWPRPLPPAPGQEVGAEVTPPGSDGVPGEVPTARAAAAAHPPTAPRPTRGRRAPGRAWISPAILSHFPFSRVPRRERSRRPRPPAPAAQPSPPPGSLPAPAHLPGGGSRHRLPPGRARNKGGGGRRSCSLAPPPPPPPSRPGAAGRATPPRTSGPPPARTHRAAGARAGAAGGRRRGLRPGCHSAIPAASPASRARGPSGGSGEDTWWEEEGPAGS